MDFFSELLTFIGGLAMFLYGMNIMGGGLEKLSGGKLERTLERLTSNKFKGVLLGALVTAVVQSSSTTTVMVVGFVNSGIMQLSQAVSIIMGANIGTTVTSWLLSLNGIQGDNIFLWLLKPTTFSPVLAIIGVIFLSMSKKGKKHDVASILIGFAMLMFGMNTMSAAVEPLAEIPEFVNILTIFSNPILGVLLGALVTGIIQSSAVSIGILQALSAGGMLNFGSAIPIIMGQNIGTCVTSLLSSVGTNKNAKRAAMVHLYFNVIGTVFFLVVYYSLDAVFDFGFKDRQITQAEIAIVHTVFNLVTTFVLLPFTKLLEKLAVLTVRGGKHGEEESFVLLDERFLSTPAFAINQCHTVTVKMANITRDTLTDSMKILTEYSEEEGERIILNENTVDEYDDKLNTYLLKIRSQNLTEEDGGRITFLQHTISDIERISDRAVNTFESAKELNDKNLKFSEKALDELKVYSDAVCEIVDLAFGAFETGDITKAKTVEPLEEVVDNLRNDLKKHHMKRLRKGKCTIEAGIVLSDLLTNFERIADHCSNIAVNLIQTHEGNFDVHEYIDELKKTEDAFFLEKFAYFTRKYALPKKAKD